MPRVIDSLAIEFVAKTSGAQKALKNLTKTLVVSAAAATALIVKGAKAFDIQAKAESSLLTALKGREDIQKRLITQAGQLQGKTLFGDEDTIQAQAYLAQLGLQENAISKLIPLVQDFATAQKTDLGTAAQLVAKSVGSSTNALSRYGIQIEGAVGSTDRLESAANALTKAFGGQASAAALAGTGPLTQFKNVMGDIGEVIGSIVTPALGTAATKINEFLGTLDTSKAKQWASDLEFSVGLFFDTLKTRVEIVRTGFKRLGQDFRIAGTETLLLLERLKGPAGNEGIIVGLTASVEKQKKAAAEMLRTQQSLADDIDQIKFWAELNRGLDQMLSELETATPIKTHIEKPLGDSQEKARDLLSTLTEIANKVTQSGDIQQGTRNVAGVDVQGLDTLAFAAQSADATTEAFGRMRDMTEQNVLASKSLAEAQALAGEQMKAYAIESAASAIASAKSFGDAAKKIIASFIRIGVAAAVSNALKNPAGIVPPVGLALAGAAGALAAALFKKLLSAIPAFGDGGIVYGPTLALIGEKGPEKITPLGRGGDTVQVIGRLRGNDQWIQNERYNSIMIRRRGIL